MLKKYLICLLATLISYQLSAQFSFDQQKLKQYLEIQSQRIGFNGSVFISKDKRSVFTSHVGLASVELSAPINRNSTFALASISKSFTAALTLIAVTEGKLKLSDSLSIFFPELTDAQWRGITIHQLLSHQSGMPHNEGIAEYFISKSTQSFTRAQAITEILSLKLIAKPGSNTKYSSPGYFLLATILENIYKKGYGQLIQEKINTSLKLQNTGQLNNRIIVQNLVQGYAQVNDQLTVAPYRSYSLMKGSGDMYSNGEDLLHFLDHFSTLNIQPDLRNKMFNAQSQGPVERGDYYGYGWFLRAKNENQPKAFYHGGGSYGVSTLMASYPEENLSIVILNNVSVIPVNEIWSDIEKIVLGKSFDLPVIRKSVELSIEDLSHFSGVYMHENGMSLQIISQDGRLYAKMGNNSAFEIFCEKPNYFYGKKVSIDLIFELGTNKQITSLRTTGNGREFNFTKKQ